MTQLAPQTISLALHDALQQRQWKNVDGITFYGQKTRKSQELHNEAIMLLRGIEKHNMALLPEKTRRRQLENLYLQLGAIVSNPPIPERMLPWLEASVMITEDIPSVAWGTELAKQAMRRFKFMPTPAEIYTLLEERAQENRNKRAILQLFIQEPIYHPIPSPERPSQSEKGTCHLSHLSSQKRQEECHA
ncbi:hypothetical protein GS501_04715 [Saccharibacter sp. 17.LH.SD]|uniref:hypothetical protein n=1 Tax=Saccharibacter sp. 17.LH.SD TaxID=2689393 RepID=UPI00136ED509|nr:hypothetical protein [Saccharibacter sp. 17.LH.SD]MXV44348.1 hypothetical protein [Saccharibacter sp. 17.LH.SD]